MFAQEQEADEGVCSLLSPAVWSVQMVEAFVHDWEETMSPWAASRNDSAGPMQAPISAGRGGPQ